MTLDEMMGSADNLAVFDSLIITNDKLKNPCYKKIMCSVSGGSDSDIMMDLVHRLDENKKVDYVFFNTGLEYQATWEHLNDLQLKYDVVINVEKAVKPIPTCCKTYGQPFLSKQVSEWVQRLQHYNFKWEDKPLDELIKEYPKCKASLRWWCNDWGEKSRFNISYNKWLKEFMMDNNPDFQISNKCCHFAKKLVAKHYKQSSKIQLSLSGVRKAEGGARSTAYKNCFTADADGVDEYRPIFWYKDADKLDYEKSFGVTHSKCYTEYGLKRTGCAGCPFGRDFENELRVIEKYEPKLFKAVNNIFGDSYEYTRKYKEFVRGMTDNECNKNTARSN